MRQESERGNAGGKEGARAASGSACKDGRSAWRRKGSGASLRVFNKTLKLRRKKWEVQDSGGQEARKKEKQAFSHP